MNPFCRWSRCETRYPIRFGLIFRLFSLSHTYEFTHSCLTIHTALNKLLLAILQKATLQKATDLCLFTDVMNDFLQEFTLNSI